MKIIIGLGNPGEKYKNTRHNVGFRIIDELREKESFSAFKLQKESKALVCEGSLNNKGIALAKPMTFMNTSGSSAKNLIGYYNMKYKTEDESILIIHDDIDLPLGKMKINTGKNSAGHKGVESIIKELKTKDFIRIRIGVQPKSGKPKSVENFVLKNFTKDEEIILNEVAENTIEAIKLILEKGLEKAMNKYN